MKLKKQIFAAVLAAAMVAPSMVSCDSSENSGTSTENSTSTATSSEAASNEASGEKVEVSWAMWVPSSVEEDNGAEERLEEKMPNVEINLMPFERATWQDQINTRVAGGDIPDIIYRDSQDLVRQYAEQGVICEIPLEMAKENAPNIYEATKEYTKEVWLATYVDGKNYGLPIMQPKNINAPTNGWRTDMLEKVGITEIPTTIEEYEEAFLKIIDADVNGSGKNDTYGFTWRGKDQSRNMFDVFFAAYGAHPDYWMINDDGTATYGWMRDEIKEGLALLRRWYEMGIIDPEFVTTDNAIYHQKIANGNVAYLTWCQWYRIQPPQGEFYLDITSTNPNATLESAPAPKGPNGDYGYSAGGPISSSTTFGSHLAKDEEKLKLCMQIVDFVSADTDDAQYIRYGTEGTDYTYSEDGVYTSAYNDDINKQAEVGVRMLDSTPGVPALQERNFGDTDAYYSRYALEGTYKYGENLASSVNFFYDPEIMSVTEDITPDFISGIIDIITGVRPLEDYDTLRQEWYDKGGQEATDEYNRAFKESQAAIESVVSQIE